VRFLLNLLRRNTGLVSLLTGLLAGLLTLASCRLAVHDAPRSDGTVRVSTAGGDCLENAFTVLQNYPSGQASESEVSGAWACAINALDTFVGVAQGKDASAFTSVAIRAFLEKNFLGKIRISDPLLTEAMRVKQVLVGGDLDHVTHEELGQTREILLTLQRESLRLLPHVQIIFMSAEQNTSATSVEKVERALEAFSQTSHVLADLLSKATEKYEFKNLEVLLAELQRIYADRGNWQGPAWLMAKIPILEHSKAFLIKPSGDTVMPSEWPRLLVSSSGLYSVYLRVYYLLELPTLLSGPGLANLKKTVDLSFALGHQAVAEKPGHVIHYDLMNPLVDDIIELGILNWKVKPATLKSLLQTGFGKVFNPPVAGVRPAVTGATHANLELFQKTIDGWLGSQTDWAALQRLALLKNPKLETVQDDSPSVVIPLTLVRELWPSLATETPQAHEDLTRIFMRKFPLSISDLGTVEFERDVQKLAFDQEAFDSLNWKQSFIRAVVMGFSADPEKNRYVGVTQTEFKNFFFDVKGLGVDLKFLDPSDDSVWSSVFSEANILTLSSDGDSPETAAYLNFNEGIDFIANALSSSKMSKRMYADLLSHCTHREPDVFGIPRWDARCYRERFRPAFADAYAEFKPWVQMTRSYSAQDWDAFEHDFESAVRKNGVSEELVESTDVDHGSAIIHYIESVFVRFDTDQSGTLNWTEAESAYPLFKSILADASGYKDDRTLKAVFAYLLANGRAPTNLADKAYFEVWWLGHPSHWTFDADRHQLLKILGQLNSKKSK
jgi:hypothetical protein